MFEHFVLGATSFSQFGDVILTVLKVAGFLGLFIFGMKLMSESIQRIAGPSLRSVLKFMTGNRFGGIVTGFITTSLIQSSSATTVMVVSFVNAGLLKLKQAAGVIMGANIGTTATAWLIVMLGFQKVNISGIAVMAIGLIFPLIFSSRRSPRHMAEFVIGFAVLFIGLSGLKEAMSFLKDEPEMLAWLANISNAGIWSTLLFIVIGTILTIVVQSSSATMAITLVFLGNGWIDFNVAAAMVLGENIGTTVTANLASLIGNIHAKRAARFHTLFNVIGVVWVLLILGPFLDLVDHLQATLFDTGLSVVDATQGGAGDADPEKLSLASTKGLSIFHTFFNVANTLLLVGFTSLLTRLVIKLTPGKKDDSDDDFSLQFITTGVLATPELSLTQARKEIQEFGLVVQKMSAGLNSLLFREDAPRKKIVRKMQVREQMTDDYEKEIAVYLSRIGEQELSHDTSHQVQANLRVLNELERMGDIFYMLCINYDELRDQRKRFREEHSAELEGYFGLIYRAIKNMNHNIVLEPSEIDMEKAYALETEINQTRSQMKDAYFARFDSSPETFEKGLLFMDFVNSAEKLGDHIINVMEALSHKKR